MSTSASQSFEGLSNEFQELHRTQQLEEEYVLRLFAIESELYDRKRENGRLRNELRESQRLNQTLIEESGAAMEHFQELQRQNLELNLERNLASAIEQISTLETHLQSATP